MHMLGFHLVCMHVINATALLGQGTSFQYPSTLSFSYGADIVRTWVNVDVDLPCSRMSEYCVNVQAAKECVDYPEFYKCTFNPPGGVALMPELLPWAKVSFNRVTTAFNCQCL